MSNYTNNKLTISPVTLLHFLITFAFLLTMYVLGQFATGSNLINIIAWIALLMCIIQIISLVKANRSILSFEVCFVILSYLFMFGQVFLVGIFGIDTLYALGRGRSVLDARYDAKNIYQACIIILTFIQCIVLGFLLVPASKTCNYEGSHTRGFIASIVLLSIGVPCHLLNSISMINNAQAFGSYDAITEQTGLIDDFSNFLIYGLLCLLFSNKLKKRRIITIFIFACSYLVVVMMLTGDRRYQTVAIIVLMIAYIKHYKIKFSFKYIWGSICGYLLLNLFFVLREIRTDNLVSIENFLNVYLNMLFDSDNNIFVQTLYEFGGSIYTVCLAVKYVPNVIEYGLGSTFLSGLIAIIPLGFWYKNSNIFQEGRIAAHLMEVGNTTVGGSVYQDLYGNFGYGGIIISIFLGLMLSKLFNAKRKYADVSYSRTRYYILFYALIHLPRASFTEVIRTAVWGLIILYMTYHIGVRSNNEIQPIKK